MRAICVLGYRLLACTDGYCRRVVAQHAHVIVVVSILEHCTANQLCDKLTLVDDLHADYYC